MFTAVDPALLERQFIRNAELTDTLRAECEDKLGTSPQYVRLTPATEAERLRCFWNVDARVKRQEGDLVFGWAIFEWPHVFWEAQHHAVWRAPDGELVDITPSVAAGTKTLFVEDADSGFDLEDGFGKPQDTQRFDLGRWESLYGYSSAGQAIHNRRLVLSREQYAGDRMLQNCLTTERMSKQALLIELANALDSNAECFCNSRTPFGQCCHKLFS